MYELRYFDVYSAVSSRKVIYGMHLCLARSGLLFVVNEITDLYTNRDKPKARTVSFSTHFDYDPLLQPCETIVHYL